MLAEAKEMPGVRLEMTALYILYSTRQIILSFIHIKFLLVLA